MKAYSQDLRDIVIYTYKQGKHSKSAISRMFRLCYDTVCEWIKREEETGDYSSKQGKGCGRSPRFNDKEAILKFIKENPDADGLAIRDAVAPNLPMSTFYDALKRLEITYKKKSLNISSGKNRNAQSI